MSTSRAKRLVFWELLRLEPARSGASELGQRLCLPEVQPMLLRGTRRSPEVLKTIKHMKIKKN